jgi:hypothetical protein
MTGSHFLTMVTVADAGDPALSLMVTQDEAPVP